MRRLYFILILSLVVLVNANARGAVKLLAIGNSFSEDAVENYLHDLAVADGQSIIIGNMYIPGCPLELHAYNKQHDCRAYRYRKIEADGKMTQKDSMQLSKALINERWDYVSLQQASQLSGVYMSYQPYLHELVNYIHQLAPQAQVIFHQTWSYAQNSTRAGFEYYGHDQLKMYHAIVSASRQAAKDEGIRIVIPVGTAIQNARTSGYGDTMNRDGFHLHLIYGRYTAACTWYAKLFGRKVSGNKYAPKGMTAEQTRWSQLSADQAVKYPWRISTIK